MLDRVEGVERQLFLSKVSDIVEEHYYCRHELLTEEIAMSDDVGGSFDPDGDILRRSWCAYYLLA